MPGAVLRGAAQSVDEVPGLGGPDSEGLAIALGHGSDGVCVCAGLRGARVGPTQLGQGCELHPHGWASSWGAG